jgi:hypothetical protein
MRETPVHEYESPSGYTMVGELKHSGLGIASFILSIICGLLIFLLIGAAGVIEASQPGGMDEESPQAVAIGLALFFFLFLALVAFGLGLGGLFQGNRKRIFAVLGMVFSAMILMGTIGIIAIGLTMG